MSEAELHILKQRMLEGKRAKARRGELGMRVPMGYVRQLSGIVVKNPDEQAQSAIERVFELFDRKLTINLTIMKMLSSPRKMKDTVREAVERGRSNF